MDPKLPHPLCNDHGLNYEQFNRLNKDKDGTNYMSKVGRHQSMSLLALTKDPSNQLYMNTSPAQVLVDKFEKNKRLVDYV